MPHRLVRSALSVAVCPPSQRPPVSAMSVLKLMLCATAVLVSTGCALVQSPAERAHKIALSAGFARIESAGALRAYLRVSGNASATRQRLTIYLESDGAAWPAADLPPRDPTPFNPLVLQMAAADDAPAVAYLGRPCQYLDAAALGQCDSALWTRGRFGEAAVASVNRAVDALKAASGAREIALAGYSGGGAMAALIAARRRDTVCLATIASPLDTAAWVRAIGVSPLRTSLNPQDHTAALIDLPQTHFTGARDTVVPPATIARFIAPMKKARVIASNEFDHDCCWVRDWPDLLRQSCLRAP